MDLFFGYSVEFVIHFKAISSAFLNKLFSFEHCPSSYHNNVSTDHQADGFSKSTHKVHQSGSSVWWTSQNKTLWPRREFV